MKRPTIALACIMKNESKNLPILLESVKDCFDEIHITDTGSTDDSVKIAESLGAKVHHFPWIMDFSAARNASFEPVQTDYIMWLDLDDSLFNRDAFIYWRDHTMMTSDYWMSPYHYALNEKGEPTCTFGRERVVKNRLGFRWKYFIHEGITPESPLGPVKVGYVGTWAVNHRRSAEDLAKDKGRNLHIFENHKEPLDARMTYYFGKEYVENQMPDKALPYLMKAIADPKLELHDRLLGIQFACYAFLAPVSLPAPFENERLERAIQLAQQGIHLAPQRAEYWCILGDAHLKKNQIAEAIPFYAAAKASEFHDPVKTGMARPLFSNQDLHTHYPRNQLARAYVHQGKWEKAKLEAKEAIELVNHPESIAILAEIEKQEALRSQAKTGLKKTSEIVISCPHQGPYEWNQTIYEKKGIGGSETAACEMAKYLAELSGEKVIVFNTTKEKEVRENVEFRPNSEMMAYFQEYEPKTHIAWRHNYKLTEAPTYLWCHDLLTPGMENFANYTKVICLSEFHKTYVRSLTPVPEEKIWVSRNGINPERFLSLEKKKIPGRVIYASSPDRGLDRAIRVMDQVVKEIPEATFHVFYGFEGMYQAGRGQEADSLRAMLNERDYIKYHGNVDQKTLAREESKACVWLYPTNFEETFCITALEMLSAGVWPIAREYGGLQNTLKGLPGDLIDQDCVTEKEISFWAEKVVQALKEKKWERFEIFPEDFSWKGVAKEWLNQFR